MRPAFYDNPQYKKKQAEITKKYWQSGLFNFITKPLELRKCANPKCTISFQVKPYDPKIYCSRSCSATINNLKRLRKICSSSFGVCIVCNQTIPQHGTKYCSLKCQQTFQYQAYISDWKAGKVDGNKGIKTQIISAHIRRYLTEKYYNKCSLCGWKERNQVTKKVPLEIDHIDGNASNNKEENLRLICPNCHSLTPHFRNLNKGHGRAWRQKQSKIV